MSARYDAIIIGAGVSGIYALHKMRELGLDARVFEAGTGVGGTWYWNRYPGARFDSESVSYQYSFSQDLIDEWRWTEQFAGQPEIERYCNFVTDRLGLRDGMTFNARVKSIHYDDDAREWEVTTESGEAARAQFILCATGLLSAHQFPDYPGVGTFEGRSLHTARWPKDPVDFSGQRVGMIGSGPTAVQILQTIAPEVGDLKLFQRTANWCTPLRNFELDTATQEKQQAEAHEVFEICRRTFGGFVHEMDERSGLEVSREERWNRYQELYDHGGFALWLGNYHDVFTNVEMAEDVAAFLAEKIRERVKDPVKAEKLIPKSHPFGTKRPPGEKNYYEAFNQDNVDVVDLRATPIEAIEAGGIRTSDGTLHELDVLIYATGFHTMTGELLRIDIRGEDGITLQDKWADGPKTNLGIQFAGFPNLFAIMGPHNPATFCNITRCVESNVEWISDCIAYLRDNDYHSISTTVDAEEEWTEHCYESVKGLVLNEMQDSWFFGNNNPGGMRGKFLMYAGGVPQYRQIFTEVAAKGYPGFELRRD